MSDIQQAQSYRSQPDQNLEWINGNMHRNYPIVDGAVPKAVSNEYLPASFLVDIQLIVPYVAGLDSSKFFVASIVRQPSALQVTIGYMIDLASGRGFDCAVSGSIPLNTQFAGTSQPYEVELAAITAVNPTSPDSSYTHGIPSGYEALRNIRGRIYIGSCVDMLSIGELSFVYAASALVPQCIFIESPTTAVSSVRFLDGYGTDRTFTDDITIRAGEGVIIDIDGQTVTFRMDPAVVSAAAAEKLAEVAGNAIKTINGQHPDGEGNFTIRGLDCTLLETPPNSNSISISNPCAKPCCDSGGTDTAEIQAALEGLEQAKTWLNDYYTDLATKVNTMQARLSSLIASRN